MKTIISQPGFRRWIEKSLAGQTHILATSNQGTILHYQDDDLEAVVKSAMGEGVVHRARLATLRREYAAYQRMEGLGGIPKCYGLVDDRYLVLEFVRGTPYRHTEFTDRTGWFERFLDIIQSFHRRGVSHGDLKSKSNIIVTPDQQPCIIDFGTAFIQKPGFRPINNYLFRYARRLDLNAWVKHKYHGRYQDASEQDRQYLNYSGLEKLLRRFRPQ